MSLAIPRRESSATQESARSWIVLQLDGCALLFQFLLELLGVFLAEGFLDGLGSAFDQVLGFLEAQAGGGADDLDDLDLLVAGGLEDDVEGGLGFFSFAGAAAAPPPPPPAITATAAGGGLDAVGFLEIGGQIDGLLEGQADDLVAQLFDFCCELLP
jgi:hypothetical protein